MNTINSYKYSAFIKMKFVPEIHKDHKHLPLSKIYRRFSHDWYMFRQQYKTVVLKFCCSFIKNSIKHFCIYCHLTFTCFYITPFGTCSGPCIKFYILCSCLCFCLCLLTICISFLHCSSFGIMIRFLVPFHVHIFCLAFFVSNHFEFLFQSFWNLYNIGC